MSRIPDRNQLMDNSYDLVLLNATITKSHAVNPLRHCVATKANNDNYSRGHWSVAESTGTERNAMSGMAVQTVL